MAEGSDSNSKVGRYILGAQLGRGGMATVYRAHDPRFGRDVALKMLHQLPHDEQDDFLVRKFNQEAKIIASLEHYAIVPVYDYGNHEGWPFLVMRLMDGGTLKDSIEQGPLPLVEIQIVLERIGAALERAHSKNVVHRDIKPTNIFMDEDGLVYLGDFGIARLTQGDQTTSYLGSPRYMAPEQAQGEPLGPWTDIYQMGVVLFEMLTGRKPYSGETPEQTILLHLQSPIPRPSDLNPDLPIGMDSVVELALAKNPADRLQTAQDLVDAFKHALHSPAAHTVKEVSAADETIAPDAPYFEEPKVDQADSGGYSPGQQPFFMDEPVSDDGYGEERSFWQKNGLIFGLATLALLLLLCGGGYLGARAAGLVGQPDVSETPEVAVVVPPVPDSGGGDSDPEPERGEAESDEPDVVELAPTATLPQQVNLLVDENEIARLGGGSGQIAFAMEQDDKFEIGTNQPDGVTAVSDHELNAFGVVYSPDGQMVAWHAEHPSRKTWDVYVANADGSGQRILTNDPADDAFPRWSPDGTQIVFHSNRNDSQFDVYVINVTGGVANQITDSSLNDLGPSFSPDGSRIIFHRQVSRSVRELFMMNADGSAERQVTNLNRSTMFASWSPDGQQLVTHTAINGNWQLVLIDPNSGTPTQITFDDRDSFYPKWSPNGEWIAYHAQASDGNRNLFFVSADGTQQVQVTDFPQQERMPDWQP